MCLRGVTVTWIVQMEVMKCQDVKTVSYFYIHLGLLQVYTDLGNPDYAIKVIYRAIDKSASHVH